MNRKFLDDPHRLSFLERLARRIEPMDGKPRSVARRIRPMKEIEGAGKVFQPGKPPRPTTGHVRMLDGSTLVFYSDGSLRHGPKQLRVTKRQRKHALRYKSGVGRTDFIIDDPKRS